jgi:hypothetical protein
MTVRAKPHHPLAEVFGFPYDNFSDKAKRYRRNKLCPFHNKVPSCTKDKANAPLGVCSIHAGGGLAITCPIRFRQDWLIAEDAAAFFFPKSTQWTSLTEVRLNDADGRSAGNIDLVLVAYDDRGQVLDFGSLEVQAVYISGNIRRPFEFYMEDPKECCDMDWSKHRYYPRPDYLSSSRKRLAPQLIYKGGILDAWNKKMAVALHRGFYDTMPKLPEVSPESANLAWLVYDLVYDDTQDVYQLTPWRTVYTRFQPALETITTPAPGPVEEFLDHLQSKLDERLENNNPPDAPVLTDILEV